MWLSRVGFLGAAALVLLVIACGKAPAAAPTSPPATALPTRGPGAGGVTINPGGPMGGMPGADWCAAGTTWSASGFAGPGGQGQYESKVIGLTEFKGKTYCKAEYTADAPGQKGTVTYYFNANSNDVWMIMDMNGQKQEMHMGQ